MGDQWYCERGAKRFGPFSPTQLKQLAQGGKLRPTDLIWKEGMPKAVPAGQAAALFPSSAEKKPAAGAAQTRPKQLPAESGQIEFIYRNSLRKMIVATLVLAAAGAFFAYLALFGNLRVIGIALPDEIGKPILWLLVLFFFLAPLQGFYFFIRDRSNPRKVVLGSDRLMVPQTNIFNRARSIPYELIIETKLLQVGRTKALSIKDANGKVELVAGLLPNPADLFTIQDVLAQLLRRR